MNSRLTEFLGMILIGDGALNLWHPRRHTALWTCGPKFYKETAQKLQSHPVTARGIGLALLGLGLWLSCKANKA